MSDNVIELNGVTKVFRTGDIETHALRGLDLTVKKGEFVAIWGPSGSGKSTALNLIGALDEPNAVTPQVHSFFADALDWVHPNDGLRRFATTSKEGPPLP